jgi:hypothetical protein
MVRARCRVAQLLRDTYAIEASRRPHRLSFRHCTPQARYTALPTAPPSLRAAGEAIYPSTDALLDCFAPLAKTVRTREREKHGRKRK